MSIAQQLQAVKEFFIQACPYCGRRNRMVVKGVAYIEEDKRELYPDIGYSFCNCKDIFYTRFENVKEDVGLQSKEKPLEELREQFKLLEPGQCLLMIMPDIFFVDWGQDPYEFLHWNPRQNHILWNLDTFCDEAIAIGYEVKTAEHDFRVGTESVQMMRIVLRRPSE